jgi:hypothetical protein
LIIDRLKRLFSEGIGLLVVSVGTMFAATFTAVSALEVVFFSEDNEAGIVEIEIFRV